MANPHGDWIWYELMTSDVEGAAAFYAPLLGWTVQNAGLEGMDYRIFSAGEHPIGGMIALPTDSPMPPCWLGYIQVDDVDVAATAIVAAGGAIPMEPHDISGVGRIALVTDPQGVFFYLTTSQSGNSLSFSSDMPRPGHCAWNELHTTDKPAAYAFYATQFGWTKDGEMEMGPLGTYDFLRHGSVIGAMMTKVPEDPHPHWLHYFRVTDLDAAFARAEASGATITQHPNEVPGGDWVFTGIDPQGAHFALVGQKG